MVDLNSAMTISIYLLVRYLIVGGVVGIAYYLISWLLLSLHLVSLGIAATVAFLVTSPIAYYLHRIVTFKKNRDIFQATRFASAAGVVFLLSYLVDIFIGESVSQNILIILTWGISSSINFFIYNVFVFKH